MSEIDTGTEASSLVREIMDAFLGPDTRALLKSVIQMGAGDALRMHAGSQPFGPQALFQAPGDVSRSITEHILQQTQLSTLQQSEQQRLAAQNQFVTQMAGTLGAQQEGFDPGGMTLTALMGRQLYGSLETQGLQRGLAQAGRYAGLLPPGMGGGGEARAYQEDLQAQLTDFNQAVMRDYTANFTQYGGLRGGDVGRLIAEQVRRGAIDPTVTGQAREDLLENVKQSAQMLGTAGQFFQGNVFQRMDQMNAMVGSNAIATLGQGQGLNDMLLQMAGTGTATNLSDQQMQMLATGSANIARQMGGSPLGALSNASTSAAFLTAANRSGVSAFVDERSLRQSIMNMTVRTQESQAARALYGGYAIMASRDGEDAAEEWLKEMQGGQMSIGRLTESVGVGAGELLSAGYSQAADRARARGDATMGMLRSRLDTIRQGRAQYLRTIGIDPGQFDGDLSVQNIEASLEDPEMSGQIRNVFNRQALRYGFNRAEEMDAALRGQVGMGRLGQAIEAMTDVEKQLQGVGTVRGAAGLINMVKQGEQGTAADFLQYLIGGAPEKVRESLMGGALAKGALEDLSPEQLVGLDRMVMALQSNTLDGKQLTEEQKSRIQETLALQGKGLREGLRSFAEDYGSPEQMFRVRVDRRTRELAEGMEGWGGLSDEAKSERLKELRDEGRLMAQIGGMEKLLESDTAELYGIEGEDRASFRKNLENLRKNLQWTGGDSKGAWEMLKANNIQDEGAYREFRQTFERNAQIQATMGGSGEGSVLTLILGKLDDLLKALTGSEGVTVNIPEKDGA